METLSFKQSKQFFERINESNRIKSAHPDRIPVIIEPGVNVNLPTLDKNKYLVPKSVTIGQFMYVVRNRIKLKPEEAIFVFVNHVLPPTSASLYDVYEEHRDEDGFLYMVYTGENTFGHNF